MNLTAQQQDQLRDKGISIKQLEDQLARFRNGFPAINLVRAAVKGDGITLLTDAHQHDCVAHYESQRESLDIIKFVPASGAATRMFKFLHEFLRDFNPQEDSLNSYINKYKAQELFTFFIAIEKFPFYKEIKKALKSKHTDWSKYSDRDKKVFFVQEMLLESGFNYACMPKGLVPFHRYKDHAASAFEEHLFEAAIYAQSKSVAKLHFTIAPASKQDFKAEFDRIKEIVQQKTGVTFELSFSHQQESTDTIAVDSKNNPVVLENGFLYFRPAGHGALLNNLNELDAQIVFIKNIDSVTISSIEQEVCFYKKMLGGYLLEVQQRIFTYLKILKNGSLEQGVQQEIEQFLTKTLCCVLPAGYDKYSTSYQLEFLFDRLHRPLRICGMVKNEGEPGGGPFWLTNQQGETSIEIVESAQVNTSNAQQVSIFKGGTHFNPVDLVCGIRDFEGNKFDLTKFCDGETGFITTKSFMGEPIKALELPGLWNGGMAFWNTVFVEVPLLTFNPVKTVNDLLKPAHQL
ncbi:MAG: DUF4301 family protein [Nonlabens sp.]|nr:DUF4301 family protein [Nonlabens sp.]